MRILVLNTDYPVFTEWLYRVHPGLETKPYEEQQRARMDSLFGVADFYSKNLQNLGHESWTISADNEYLQRAWASEHGVPLPPKFAWKLTRRKRIIPWLVREPDMSWFYDVLAAQIRFYQPDVLLNLALVHIDAEFLSRMRGSAKLLVGQVASPFTMRKDFHNYDLILSSLPGFVEKFRAAGIAAELHRLAFESSILEKFGDVKQTTPVSFIGSLSNAFQERIRWLEYVCSHVPVRVWSARIENLAIDSPIRAAYAGTVWGIEMYKVIQGSKITLNHHIDVAGRHANNLRLFEATGAGSLLITDWKENLNQLFEPAREVVLYRSAEECVEKIEYYLKNDKERETVALAGQKRTLRDHTYRVRIEELLAILQKYVS